MKTSRKHLLALTLLTALSPLAPTSAFAQLHLEIAKAPDQAPKIAIVPFNNDNGLYPIVETDLNRSGRFTSSSKTYLQMLLLTRFKHLIGKLRVFLMLLLDKLSKQLTGLKSITNFMMYKTAISSE